MNILIFANCQGSMLKDFFPKTMNVTAFHNFTYVYHTFLDNKIKECLSTCDYFIYQPLSSVYHVYNTENLKTFLKPTCKTISFPYIFNDAFTPIYKSIKANITYNGEYTTNQPHSIIYKNIEPILELKNQGLSLESIYDLYDNNKIDFKYQERFEKTIKILQDHEKNTDIKVSQFIIDNHKKHRLFNYHNNEDVFNKDEHFITYCNHPSNILFKYYLNQILILMNLEQITYNALVTTPELAGSGTLVSRYDINHYKYEWVEKEDEIINNKIKHLIGEIYSKF